MAKPVGCGESANRIERVRLTNDAVPFGHHILQTHALYFRRKACRVIVGAKNFRPYLGHPNLRDLRVRSDFLTERDNFYG
jgi:hypothetical protein